MKHARIIRIAVFLLLLMLAACSAIPAAKDGGKIQLQDGLGREVLLEKPAARIISLSPSVTEILFAVGAGSQVVGATLSPTTLKKSHPSRMLAVQWEAIHLRPSPALILTW